MRVYKQCLLISLAVLFSLIPTQGIIMDVDTLSFIERDLNLWSKYESFLIGLKEAKE